jgi:serine/threonine protein kinase
LPFLLRLTLLPLPSLPLPYCSAPEVLSGKRCTEKVDLYSYGVVIWEVCTGDVPVRGEMRPLVAPQDCPQEVVDLHNLCISERPEERPTAAELLTTLAPLL